MSDSSGQRLRASVEAAFGELQRCQPDDVSRRPAPGAWSVKEIIGHLIDSASNNHQRFVRACLQDDLVFPGYDQDRWVAIQEYQRAPWPELLSLWREYNLQLARVMEVLPEESRQRLRERHNLHQLAFRPVPPGVATTLSYFMNDYVDHLEHHLAQVRRLLFQSPDV